MHQYIHMQELQKMREKQLEEERSKAEEDLPAEEEETELEPVDDEALTPAEDDTHSPDSEQQENGRLEKEFRATLEDERLRFAAEMENFKKRLTREYQEQLRFAAEKVLGDLLPSLDNMDLALQYGSANEACKDMVQGVAMTRKLLDEALKKHGLSKVGEAGEDFDPAIHEAVGFEHNPDYPSGHVAKVLQSGYKLNERLLRPAKVMINQ